MDQIIVNSAFALIGFLGAFVLNGLSGRVTLIETTISSLPFTYVAKSDYAQDMQEVKEMLRRIDEKLDRKVDK
jgi:hypothetical protein